MWWVSILVLSVWFDCETNSKPGCAVWISQKVATADFEPYSTVLCALSLLEHMEEIDWMDAKFICDTCRHDLDNKHPV